MSSLFQLLVKVCVNKWKVQVSKDTRYKANEQKQYNMSSYELKSNLFFCCTVFKEKHFIHLFVQIKMFNTNSPTCNLVEKVNIVESLVLQC